MRQPSQGNTQRRQLMFRLDASKADQLLSRLAEQGLSLQRWVETQVDQLLSPAELLSPALLSSTESQLLSSPDPTVDPTPEPDPEWTAFREPDEDEEQPDPEPGSDEDLEALIDNMFAEQRIPISKQLPVDPKKPPTL